MIVGTALSWNGTAWVPVHALNWDIPFVGNVDLGLGFAAYNGLTAVVVNAVLSAALSLALRSRARDETSPADYRRSGARLNIEWRLLRPYFERRCRGDGN